jgi:ubiquinone/menaquinone biosynthesis C-methylase UbiE
MVKRYFFEEVFNCEMCGDKASSHKVLGQRLNQSQGLSPKTKTGISVSVKQCNRCKVIYSSPQPIPFDIQDHYGMPPDTYWIPSYFEIDESYFSREIKEVKSLMDFRTGMKALDVGAGLGRCMIALDKAGFTSYGFEPSKPFYERAITKMGMDKERLKLGAIEEVEYPEGFFDFITYGAVLEHLYHPSASIAKTLKWLRPTGIIHIEVPSSRWLIASFINFYYRLVGTNFVTNLSPMHAPFHLYEFDLKSFELLGERLGFKIVKHRHEVCEIPFIPRLFHRFVGSFMRRTNKGMQLTVYLQKN